jgi:H+-transporting ATPase
MAMITTLDQAALRGLTSPEAAERLHQYGLNQIPEERTHPLRLFLSKFMGPVPFMLEGTLVLQLLLGKQVDATIIACVLVVNSIISFTYERKAQDSLALLQQRLTVQTRVLRDGVWQLMQTSELVPGDIVRLRVGDIVPADVQLLNGHIAVDQSSLTGESDLHEVVAGDLAFAASVIRRGEAIAEITATGMQTSFSQTAKLVQNAKTASHGDAFVQKVVTYLMGLTALLVAIVLIYALIARLPMADILLFTLSLLIAAIPVSLPVTFTLATAVGSRELAEQGVLTTRLSAIKEAAGMDILCSDKTGTLTKNELSLVGMQTYNGYSEDELLHFAALACDDATHDPIDLAIVKAARAAKLYKGHSKRLEFVPFDPATKRTEALVRRPKKKKKRPIRVLKGAPYVISQLTRNPIDLTAATEELAQAGNRCIAIAKGREGKAPKLVGLLALQDPPREDAASVVNGLRELGVQVLMVTGDGLATARNIAQKIGIMGRAGSAELLEDGLDVDTMDVHVFANVYPEDKYKLVKALQKAGHVVGMTGDGINDAPAIKQAEIGVAVNNATDITKSAASFVLTEPGLKDMLAAVVVGRRIFQRMWTYTLNKIIKTIHMGLFLAVGLLMTGILVARPTHILMVVLANDLVSMALTTDRVRPSAKPDRWRLGPMVICGLVMALAWLVFSFAIFFYGRDSIMLSTDQLQTTMFVMLVLVAQANVYLIRERFHFWHSQPSHWMLLATAVDLLVVTVLALQGILMAPIALWLLLQLVGAAIVFAVLLDFLKVKVFRYFALS